MTEVRNSGLHIANSASGQPNWLPGLTEAATYLAEDRDRPISAAWATSLLTSRLQNSHFLDIVGRFHHVNPEATHSEAQRRFLSAEQASLLAAQQDGNLPFPTYPSEAYTDSRIWPHVYRWLRTTSQGYGNQYFTNIVQRELTTAVPQRTVARRIIGRVLSHLIGEEPVWANCGCGDMSGDRLDWLSLHDERFGYADVEVVDDLSVENPIPSLYKGDILRRIILESDDTKRMVGLDRVDPTLQENKDYTRACATPEELWSGKRDDAHGKLMEADVPSDWLHFYLADLAKRGEMRAVVEQERKRQVEHDGYAKWGGQFDAASAFFSWYHGPAETRRRKLLNMRNVLVRSEGLIVIADFARTVARDTFLMPDDIWTRPTVFVGYKGKLYPALRASNGRFRRVEVMPALGMLARRGPHVREVLKLVGRAA